MNVVVCKKNLFLPYLESQVNTLEILRFFKNHAFLKTAEVSKTSFSYSQIDR